MPYGVCSYRSLTSRCPLRKHGLRQGEALAQVLPEWEWCNSVSMAIACFIDLSCAGSRHVDCFKHYHYYLLPSWWAHFGDAVVRGTQAFRLKYLFKLPEGNDLDFKGLHDPRVVLFKMIAPKMDALSYPKEMCLKTIMLQRCQHAYWNYKSLTICIAILCNSGFHPRFEGYNLTSIFKKNIWSSFWIWVRMHRIHEQTWYWSNWFITVLGPTAAANGGFRNGAGCLGQPAEEWAPAMA